MERFDASLQAFPSTTEIIRVSCLLGPGEWAGKTDVTGLLAVHHVLSRRPISSGGGDIPRKSIIYQTKKINHFSQAERLHPNLPSSTNFADHKYGVAERTKETQGTNARPKLFLVSYNYTFTTRPPIQHHHSAKIHCST